MSAPIQNDHEQRGSDTPSMFPPTATMYARLHDNVHWLSDTVAGAAIGISTAHFTMNRREQRAHSGEWSIAPTEHGGAMLSYTVPLH